MSHLTTPLIDTAPREPPSPDQRLAAATLTNGANFRPVGIAAIAPGGVLVILKPGAVYSEYIPAQAVSVLRGLPKGYRLATAADLRAWEETVAERRVTVATDDANDVTAYRRRR